MITIKITIIYIYIYLYIFIHIGRCMCIRTGNVGRFASALSGCGSPEADGHDQDAGGQPPGLMVLPSLHVPSRLPLLLASRAEDVEFCSAFEEGWEGSYPVFLIGLARSPGPALRFHRCLGGNGLL